MCTLQVTVGERGRGGGRGWDLWTGGGGGARGVSVGGGGGAKGIGSHSQGKIQDFGFQKGCIMTKTGSTMLIFSVASWFIFFFELFLFGYSNSA